jgi:hypothetical protein
MNRIILLTFGFLVAGCGWTPSPAPTEPGTATAPIVVVPDNWVFLDLPSIDRLVNASDEYIGVAVSGEQDTVLARAVAGAQQGGWDETRRKDVFDGYKVYFEGSDGSQLCISTRPWGEQVELTATIAPPE